MSISWLALQSDSDFPLIDQANEDGLLAVGGDLSSTRLINAYQHGVFPWFNQHDPILWWSPDPRMVLFTNKVKIAKSLKRTLRSTKLTVTIDHAFEQVMEACSLPREDNEGTWIHQNMINAYVDLYQQGHAHSVECWLDGKLVGGLYGIAIGNMFFGESMFSHVRDSSKVALVALCKQLHQWGFPLIDCQVYSKHLESLGAEEISRSDFLTIMTPLCHQHHAENSWRMTLQLS
jgi:leucyl/phenylalanyl-tRNA--protein transferase